MTSAPSRPQLPRPLALFGGQFLGDDRDKDDVVDAEDDLKNGQGRQRGQGLPCKYLKHQSVMPRMILATSGAK